MSLGLGLLVLTVAFVVWIFIDRNGPTQTGHPKNLPMNYDMSRLERGFVESSDAHHRSGKEKSN